jgi:TonB family protein
LHFDVKNTKGYPMKNSYFVFVVLFFLLSGYVFIAQSQDLAPKKNKSKYGYVDKRDTVVIPYQFDEAEFFYDGLAAVKMDTKWGFIDKTGKIVISCQFETVYNFSDGVCPVRKNNKWYFINKKGKKSIDAYFQLAFPFAEGLAAVKTETGWGFIDKEGSMAIKAEYEEASSFSEGLAAIKDAGVWGYINPQGETVIDFKYDEAHHFVKGLAIVKLNNKTFQIDKNGKKYVPPKDEQKEDPNMIYTTVDQLPEFPGGYKEMSNFLLTNIQYPAEEKQNKVEGLVIITFIVTREGELKNFQVTQGDNENFKKEALRVVQLMPKWNPGINKGKPVNVQTNIPVRFRMVNK